MEHGRSGFSDETSFGGMDTYIIRGKNGAPSTDARVLATNTFILATDCEDVRR